MPDPKKTAGELYKKLYDQGFNMGGDKDSFVDGVIGNNKRLDNLKKFMEKNGFNPSYIDSSVGNLYDVTSKKKSVGFAGSGGSAPNFAQGLHDIVDETKNPLQQDGGVDVLEADAAPTPVPPERVTPGIPKGANIQNKNIFTKDGMLSWMQSDNDRRVAQKEYHKIVSKSDETSAVGLQKLYQENPKEAQQIFKENNIQYDGGDDPEFFSKAADLINDNRAVSIVQSEKEGASGYAKNVNSFLISKGYNPDRLSKDNKYVGVVITSLKEDEQKEIDAAKKAVPVEYLYFADNRGGTIKTKNTFKQDAAVEAVASKYAMTRDLVGTAAMNGLAEHGETDPYTLGMKKLEIANPTAYKTIKEAKDDAVMSQMYDVTAKAITGFPALLGLGDAYKNKTGTVAESQAVMDGFNALLHANKGAAVAEDAKKLLQQKKDLEIKYPEARLAEIRNKIGYLIRENQPLSSIWQQNSTSQVNEAIKQLPADDQSFIKELSKNNPSGYPDVMKDAIIVGRNKGDMFGANIIPTGGALNAVRKSVGQSVSSLGDLVDVTRGDDERRYEGLSEPYRNETLGESPYAQELKQLMDKKEDGDKLSEEQEGRLSDLKTFASELPTTQRFVNGTLNITTQVLVNAFLTKGFLGAEKWGMSTGASVLVKSSEVAKGLRAAEGAADLVKGGKIAEGTVGVARGTDIADGATELAKKFAALKARSNAVAGAAEWMKKGWNAEKVYAGIVGGALTYESAAKRGATLFDGESGAWFKTRTYAILTSLGEAFSESIFRNTKTWDAFKKDLRVPAAAIAREMYAGKITKQALRGRIAGLANTIYKYAGHVAVENNKEMWEEVASQLNQSMWEGVLAYDKFDKKEAMDDIVSTGTTMFLHGWLAAGMAGIKDVRTNKIHTAMWQQVANDGGLAGQVRQEVNRQHDNGEITTEDFNEKNLVLNSLVQASNDNAYRELMIESMSRRNIAEDVKNQDVSDEQNKKADDLFDKAGKYLAVATNDLVLRKKYEESTSASDKAGLQKQIDANNKIKEGLAGGKLTLDAESNVVETPKKEKQKEDDTKQAQLAGSQKEQDEPKPDASFEDIVSGIGKQDELTDNEKAKTEVPKSSAKAGVTDEGNDKNIKPTEERKGIKEEVGKYIDEVNSKFRPLLSEGSDAQVAENLKGVAEQAGSSKIEREGAVNNFGENIVNIAEREFPDAKASVKEGGDLDLLEKQLAKEDAATTAVSKEGDVAMLEKKVDEEEGRRGAKQLKTAFGLLDDANSQIDKANAIIKIRNNERNGGVLTSDEKEKVEKAERDLTNDGYEIPNLRGEKYNEEMKVTASFIPDTSDALLKGEEVITRVIKPLVNKDGEMVQSAQVEVTIGNNPNGLPAKEWIAKRNQEKSKTQDAGTTAAVNTPIQSELDKINKAEEEANENQFNTVGSNSMVFFNPNGDNLKLTKEQLRAINRAIDKRISEGKTAKEINAFLINEGFVQSSANTAHQMELYLQARIDNKINAKIGESISEEIAAKYQSQRDALNKSNTKETQDAGTTAAVNTPIQSKGNEVEPTNVSIGRDALKTTPDSSTPTNIESKIKRINEERKAELKSIETTNNRKTELSKLVYSSGVTYQERIAQEIEKIKAIKDEIKKIEKSAGAKINLDNNNKNEMVLLDKKGDPIELSVLKKYHMTTTTDIGLLNRGIIDDLNNKRMVSDKRLHEIIKKGFEDNLNEDIKLFNRRIKDQNKHISNAKELDSKINPAAEQINEKYDKQIADLQETSKQSQIDEREEKETQDAGTTAAVNTPIQKNAGESKEQTVSTTRPKEEVGENDNSYKGSHQLGQFKATADDLTKGGTGFDWETVAQDHDLSDKPTKESYRILKGIKDNPDAEVTIYRAVPKDVNKINDGDWVTLSKTYAKEHGMDESDASKDNPVISQKVKAKDLAWDGNDLNEFAYKPIESKQELNLNNKVPIEPGTKNAGKSNENTATKTTTPTPIQKSGEVKWDKDKNYRGVDDAEEATGKDRSFKKGEPFDDAVFTMEFGDLKGEDIEHHKGSSRGDLTNAKPERIYFDTEELPSDELDTQLSKLKKKFPDAEYIPIRIDDNLKPQYDYGYDTETTEPQVTRPTPIQKNADESNVEETVPATESEIDQRTESAKKVLSNLFPNATLEVFETDKEYVKAGGADGSRGVAIMTKSGKHRILLNKEIMREDGVSKTAFHEVIHPIVEAVIGSDPDTVIGLWNGIAEEMDGVEGMDLVFKHMMWYKGDATKATEGITEFLTRIATGQIDIDKIQDVPKRNRIQKLIKDLLDFLGFSGKEFDMKNFASSIKKAFATGEVDGIRGFLQREGNSEGLFAENRADRQAEQSSEVQFQKTEGVDARTETMVSAIEKAVSDNNGEGLTLDKLKNKVAGVVKSNKLDDLVEDAYNEFSKRTIVSHQDVDGNPIKNELTSQVSKRIANSFSKMFGGYTGEVFTIVKNSDAVVKATQGSDAKFMGHKGKILGAIVTDKNGVPRVILNGEQVNGNTAIHEAAGHILMDWYEKNNPGVFEEGLKKVIGSKYLSRVQNSTFYKGLAEQYGKEGSKEYDRYMQKEALAMAIGDSGGQFFTESKRNGFKEWAKKLWQSVGKFFGIEGKTSDEISKMSLDEFSKHAAAQLLDPDATFKSIVEDAEKRKAGKQRQPERGEGDRITSNRNADTKVLRDEFGLGDRNVSPETSEQWDAQARERLAVPGALKELVQSIKDGRYNAGGAEESMFRISIEEAAAKARETLSPRDINDLHELIKASEMAGKAAGSDLRARRRNFAELDPLMQDLIEKKEALSTDELSEEQIKEVKDVREDIDKKQKAFDDVTEPARNKKIQEARNEAAKKALGKRKKAKKMADAQRNSQITKAKAALEALAIKRSKAKFAAEGEPNVRLQRIDEESAPLVMDIVDSLTKEGKSIQDIAKESHEILSNYFDEITPDDVLDVMAGMYDVRATKLQLKEQELNHIRLLDRIKKFNKIKKKHEESEGDDRKQYAARLSHINDEIAGLGAFVNSNYSIFGGKKFSVTGQEYNEGVVESNLGIIKSKIKDGDYAEAAIPPVKVKYTKEQAAAKRELVEAQADKEIQNMKDSLASEYGYKKYKKMVLSIVNIPRALTASFDFSGLGRQGKIVVYSHPLIAAKAAREGLNAMFSKTSYSYDEWFHDLKERDNYRDYISSELALSDVRDPDLSKQEEMFASNYANAIPGVKQSERGYTIVLNDMRVSLFDMYADRMRARGLTMTNSLEQYKAMASYVNTITGRGNVPKWLESAAPTLNATLFSPRLMFARLRFLTYFANPYFYRKMPKEIRVAYVKDLGMTVAAGFVNIALEYAAISAYKAVADPDDDKKLEFGTEPGTANWGKIVYDDTHLDMWGGFQQYVRMFDAAYNIGKEIGKRRDEDKSTYGLNVLDPVGRALRYKFSPTLAIPYDYFIAGGENPIGEKVVFGLENPITGDMIFGKRARENKREISIGEYARGYVTPFSLMDTYEAGRDKGLLRAAFALLHSEWGNSVNTYKETKTKKKQKQSDIDSAY